MGPRLGSTTTTVRRFLLRPLAALPAPCASLSAATFLLRFPASVPPRIRHHRSPFLVRHRGRIELARFSQRGVVRSLAFRELRIMATHTHTHTFTRTCCTWSFARVLFSTGSLSRDAAVVRSHVVCPPSPHTLPTAIRQLLPSPSLTRACLGSDVPPMPLWSSRSFARRHWAFGISPRTPLCNTYPPLCRSG